MPLTHQAVLRMLGFEGRAVVAYRLEGNDPKTLPLLTVTCLVEPIRLGADGEPERITQQFQLVPVGVDVAGLTGSEGIALELQPERGGA